MGATESALNVEETQAASADVKLFEFKTECQKNMSILDFMVKTHDIMACDGRMLRRVLDTTDYFGRSRHNNDRLLTLAGNLHQRLLNAASLGNDPRIRGMRELHQFVITHRVNMP